MNKIFSNLIFRIYVIGLIIHASLHILSSLIYAVKSHNYEALNIFSILQINLLFPDLSNGLINFILSYLFSAGIFIIAYFILRNNKKD
jgi:hypothetical protein